jgi:hypothetical protein
VISILNTKGHKKLNTKITNNLINKWTNELNRHFSNEEEQMAIKNMKTIQHPISLSIRKMQMKTILEFHFTPIQNGYHQVNK